MKFSHEQEGLLLALVWSLKNSDRSIIKAFCDDNQNEEVHVGTGKDSANYVFYSKLESWNLAQEILPPKLAVSEKDQEYFESIVKTFVLKSEAKPILSKALLLVHASNGILPPDGAVLSPDVHEILKKYDAEKNIEAHEKLVAVLTRGIETALVDAGMLDNPHKMQSNWKKSYFGEGGFSWLSIIMQSVLCIFLFFVSGLAMYVGWLNDPSVMIVALLPLMFGFFIFIPLIKLFMEMRAK